MSPVVRNFVFGISDQVRHEPACLALQTCQSREITGGIILHVENNKGADQTAWMRKLICTNVVRNSRRRIFLSYVSYNSLVYEPRRKKTCVRGFRPGPTQIVLSRDRTV